ncbi:hypothetical protein SAMN06265337_1230 [Hymenobacter gelipurpurascens]|uniref:Uncharacterized protein n=1 Tax=Hymenobacter gelipurpurascens TaxID=89968 RepID=A0A212TH57_9BACT|nr:hypothetical protein [Hymenobacter gelipurpurascens]SNC65174.1 hypothetical protein SAMN06265337_1230 [Hymenobacter gelipurpurascens]
MPRIYAIQGISFSELLEKDGYSRTYIKNNVWKYHHILTKVLFKSVIYRNSPGEYVKINIAGLDRDLGNSKIKGKRIRFSTQIIQDLTKWKILKKKYLHKQNEDLSFMTTVFLKVPQEVLAKGWQKAPVASPLDLVRARKTDRAPLSGVYLHIQRYLAQVSIDADAARAYADHARAVGLPLRSKRKGYILHQDRVVDQQVHSHWMMSIDEVEQGNFELKVDATKTGRHFTSFTNLPRELRPFLRINGRRVVELDIRNSQPLIFGLKLKELYGDQVPEDVQHYLNLVQQGTFYDTIKDFILEAKEVVQEETFKTDFFARVFFSTENVDYKWRRIFDRHFPSVSQAITQMKLQDYKLLSHHLMQAEAQLLVHQVAARLYREGTVEFFTLHDAIYCPADVVDEVYSIINEEYQAVGLQVTIKDKPLTRPTIEQLLDQAA